MLKKPPTNLNKQSQDATVHLIRAVLSAGINLTEVYVDALGNTTTYEAYLSKMFPGIAFTVESKADSKWKIVGAASVAAKVTRDACIDGWYFEEEVTAGEGDDGGKGKFSKKMGSGYPGGTFVVLQISVELIMGLDQIPIRWRGSRRIWTPSLVSRRLSDSLGLQ